VAPKQFPGGARRVAAEGPLGLRELDRFSETSLERWNAVYQDLDELQDSLYFGLEPERRRYRPDLIAALNSVASVDLCMAGWCRAVTYRYSLAPLSCAGSLQYIGGRFNAGTELDPQTLAAWPALYLAADFETAFREKFQLTVLQEAQIKAAEPQTGGYSECVPFCYPAVAPKYIASTGGASTRGRAQCDKAI
jgi:hypothetical protein